MIHYRRSVLVELFSSSVSHRFHRRLTRPAGSARSYPAGIRLAFPCRKFPRKYRL